MDPSQNNNNPPPSNNVPQENNNNNDKEYPSLSQLGLEVSAGDVRYDSQGSNIENNNLSKNQNFFLIKNSSDSIIDVDYNSNDNQQNNNNSLNNGNNLNNNISVNNANDLNNNISNINNVNQNQNSNVPNLEFSHQNPPNPNINNSNVNQSNSFDSYNSRDNNAGPPEPAYAPNNYIRNPNQNIPLGHPRINIIPPYPYPEPIIRGRIIPDVVPIYPMRHPLIPPPIPVYPYPYPPHVYPDYYPYYV